MSTEDEYTVRELEHLEHRVDEINKRLDEIEKEDKQRLRTALSVLGGLFLALLAYIASHIPIAIGK